MRLASFASLVAISISCALVTTAARADVGPRAPCASGEHHQYLYGHRCVPDGSHLEQDDKGNVQIVKDGSSLAKSPPTPPAPAVVEPPPTPSTSAFATPPAPAESARVPPSNPPLAVEPPHERGCACDLREPDQSLPLGAFGLAALLFTVARRRASRGKSAP